jgi:hypothetical protein
MKLVLDTDDAEAKIAALRRSAAGLRAAWNVDLGPAPKERSEALAAAFDAGFDAHVNEAFRQRMNPDYPITRVNPYRA